MKKINIDVFIEKFSMCSIMLLLMITPTLATNVGQDGLNPGRNEGAGTENANGTMRIVDFRDLAIFVGYWLETDCNVANNFCSGADLDHLYDVDYDGYPSDVDCEAYQRKTSG